MKKTLLLFVAILFAISSCEADPVIHSVAPSSGEEDTSEDTTSGDQDQDDDQDDGGTSSERDGSTLLVGTFNIRYYNNTDDYPWSARKDAVMSFINDEKPDFLGLQEIRSVQAANFMTELGSDFGYYDINRDTGSSIVGTSGEGVGIIYRTDRFTIANKGFFWLADPSDELPEENANGTYSSWNSACRRVVVWVEAVDNQHDDQTVWFFATHFDHQSATARLNSSTLCVSKIQELTGISDIANSTTPIFLVGDFNCTYDSAHLAPLRECMSDARTTAAVSEPDQRTYNAFAETGGSIIDHIFYVGNISADVYDVVTEDYGVAYISDHYPVLFQSTYQ